MYYVAVTPYSRSRFFKLKSFLLLLVLFHTSYCLHLQKSHNNILSISDSEQKQPGPPVSQPLGSGFGNEEEDEEDEEDDEEAPSQSQSPVAKLRDVNLIQIPNLVPGHLYDPYAILRGDRLERIINLLSSPIVHSNCSFQFLMSLCFCSIVRLSFIGCNKNFVKSLKKK
jgi:hypothetical protein